MNYCTIFVVFIIIGSTFNVDAEPVFRKPGGVQKEKRIIVKQTGGHGRKRSGHRSHRKPMPCMCVAESTNANTVTAISRPSGVIPGKGVDPIIDIPGVVVPGTGVDPIIDIPGDGSSVTTATTGAATTFVPGM